jgi:hypothetical protein
VVLGHGHILVGTVNSEILEISKEGPMNVLVQVWQPSFHCIPSSMRILVTEDITSELPPLNEVTIVPKARLPSF